MPPLAPDEPPTSFEYTTSGFHEIFMQFAGSDEHMDYALAQISDLIHRKAHYKELSHQHAQVIHELCGRVQALALDRVDTRDEQEARAEAAVNHIARLALARQDERRQPTLQAQLNAVLTRLTALEAEHKRLGEENKRLGEENKRLGDRLTVVEAENKSLRKENERLADRLTVVEAENKSLHKDTNSLRDQLAVRTDRDGASGVVVLSTLHDDNRSLSPSDL